MLSDQDMKQARELCNAIESTPSGDWKLQWHGTYGPSIWDAEKCLVCRIQPPHGDWSREIGDFIAESRTFMPKFLDEVKRLKERVEKQDAFITEFIDGENHGERYPPTP